MNKPNTTPQNMPEPSFFQRIPLAFGTFFSILSDAGFAARIRDLPVAAAQPAVPEAPKAVAPRPLREAPIDAALQLLGLLQRDARLIDFAEENLTGYSDADIGAPPAWCTRVAARCCASISPSSRCVRSPRAAASP